MNGDRKEEEYMLTIYGRRSHGGGGREVMPLRMGIQAVVDRESNGSKNKQLKNYGQKNNSAQRTLGGGGGGEGGSHIKVKVTVTVKV